jgi:repressor LexA
VTSINFADNLKKYRKAKGITKAELSRRIGVSDVTVGHWENGKISPRMGKVEMIAEILGVSVDDLLLGVEPNQYKNKLPKGAIPTTGRSDFVPLYGSIAAGMPLEMNPINEYIEIPASIAEAHPDAFLLRVSGDSMNKVIPSGAYALIEPCEEVQNGEIVAVIVNGSDATLKRFYRLQNSIVLEPDSTEPTHTARTFSNSEADELIKLIGRMVWYMSPFNVKY